VGKGALAPCPPLQPRRCWWARYALPTLQSPYDIDLRRPGQAKRRAGTQTAESLRGASVPVAPSSQQPLPVVMGPGSAAGTTRGLRAATFRIQTHKDKDTGPRSRGAFRPSFCMWITLLRNQRVQGRPGGRCTRGSRAKRDCARREDHRYRRDHPDLPCAVVYGLYALSPVNQHLPPSSAQCVSIIADLAPAWARQDHTTSPSAKAPHVYRHSSRPPHSAPRS